MKPYRLSNQFGKLPIYYSSQSSKFIVDNDTAIGIELEIEGLGAIAYPDINTINYGMKYWSVTNDGSLRDNGKEFVSGMSMGNFILPIKGADIVNALDEINRILNKTKEGGYEAAYSRRTSTHVHIDCMDMTNEELYRMALLYAVFEKPLFRFCGEGRYDNNYCYPISRDLNLQNRIKSIYSNNFQRGLKHIIDNRYVDKYDSMNLLSLSQKGSVEFRGMEGTDDFNKILDWINVLLSLKKAAKNLTEITIDNLFPTISAEGFARFAENIFGSELLGKLSYANLESDILSGIRVAQAIHLSDVKVNTSRNSDRDYIVEFAAANNLITRGELCAE